MYVCILRLDIYHGNLRYMDCTTFITCFSNPSVGTFTLKIKEIRVHSASSIIIAWAGSIVHTEVCEIQQKMYFKI